VVTNASEINVTRYRHQTLRSHLQKDPGLESNLVDVVTAGRDAKCNRHFNWHNFCLRE